MLKYLHISNIFLRFVKKLKIWTMNSTTKRERFKKVAGNRVQRLLDTFALLSNCSNKNNYEYSQEDVEKMFSVINAALRDCQKEFSDKRKQDKKPFSFNN